MHILWCALRCGHLNHNKKTGMKVYILYKGAMMQRDGWPVPILTLLRSGL